MPRAIIAPCLKLCNFLLNTKPLEALAHVKVFGCHLCQKICSGIEFPNLFMLFEPLAGRRYGKVTERRTRVDWAHLIRDLCDTHYPHAEKIVLVMDNLNTHAGASLYEAFAPAEAKRLCDRLEIHYAPKHGSWLNVAEIELSVLQRQCLRRRLPEIESLARETCAWTTARNNAAIKAQWQFTTPDARVRLKHLYPRILKDGILERQGKVPIWRLQIHY